MSVRIWPGACVAEDARIDGDCEIGKGTVIHPGASLLALVRASTAAAAAAAAAATTTTTTTTA